MRTVFINPEQCIGCLQCEIACAVEHSASQDASVAFLEKPTPRKRIHVEPGPVGNTAYPNSCRHCDAAPCLPVCPAGAIGRQTTDGLVLVDEERCIGCAICAVVCPFDVLTFHPLAGGPDDIPVAVKCDGCIDRVQRGEAPACVEVCKAGALVYGEVNELVAARRLHGAGAILAAAAAPPPTGPDQLAGWHAWGEAQASARDAAEADWDGASPDGAIVNGHQGAGDREEDTP